MQIITTAEITALRKELEDALMKAFTDFQTVTGCAVSCCGIESVEVARIGQQAERRITSVRIQLDGL